MKEDGRGKGRGIWRESTALWDIRSGRREACRRGQAFRSAVEYGGTGEDNVSH
ncbi:MAG: hypothetical protein JXA82_16030 [Sedimentisphaerales bacterium]|nr:hypothetical protein [Sedimentisphaerales bacterium]